MMLSRRQALTAMSGLAAAAGAAALSSKALAADPDALVVFDGQLRNGWASWSWATVDLSAQFDGRKAIKVEGAAYSALQLHRSGFSTKGLSKIIVTLNGGVDGGQKIGVVTADEQKHLDPYKMFDDLAANTWRTIETPLAECGAADTTIAALLLQSPMAYKPYYVSMIRFA